MHARAAAQKIASKWDAARLVLRRGGVGILLERALRRGLEPIGTWNTLEFFERDLADVRRLGLLGLWVRGPGG